MKRFFAILLTGIIGMIMLSGCSNKSFTAYELYGLSINAINDAGGFKVESEISVTSETYNEEISIKEEINGDNWHIWYSTSIDDFWFEEHVVDGMLYITDGYDKAKLESGDSGFPVIEDYLPKIGAELLENAEVIETDGCYSLVIEPTDDILASIFDGMLEEFINDGYSRENSIMTLSFDSDGIIVSVEYIGDISGEFINGETTAHIAGKCVFIDVGVAPDVSAPADADDYELVE